MFCTVGLFLTWSDLEASVQVVGLAPGPAVLCSPVPFPGAGEMPSSVSLNTVFLAFWSSVLSLQYGPGVVLDRLSVVFDSVGCHSAPPSLSQDETPWHLFSPPTLPNAHSDPGAG